MRVMGIDPGLTRTGYGIVEEAAGELRVVEHGTLRADTSEAAPAQLLALRRGLGDVIGRHRPGAAAVERLFVNANRRTAMRAGQASGVALLAAAEAGLAVHEYTPSEVKRAVVGNGAATKDQVAYMVKTILGLRGRLDSPDAADALALAICHAHGSRLRTLAATTRRAAR